VVRRGYDELVEVTGFRAGEQAIQVQDLQPEPPLPPMLRQLPQSQAPLSDVHRFWEQTGNFYARGMGNDNLADPFIATGTMPATTALFRDMTGIRFEHPEWIAENCTACGDCYTICPDTAIPGLVSEVTPVLDTVLARVRRAGHELSTLPRALRQLEGKLRPALAAAPSDDNVRLLLRESIAETGQGRRDEDERSTLRSEFDLFEEALGDFQFALSRPYFTLPEKNEPGSGGLLSITINPYTCKGCMECVAVCNDDALRPVTQTRTASPACATTGTCGRTCRTHRSATSASTISTRASAPWRPCCSTRTPTAPSPAATVPAWAAPRRPPCTCSRRPWKH
jgi:pyruvate-ferredoxin/flavodoxin oxidoreductase